MMYPIVSQVTPVTPDEQVREVTTGLPVTFAVGDLRNG